MTENVAIHHLIYWGGKIPLINLASEALQYSPKCRQGKFNKKLCGVHAYTERERERERRERQRETERNRDRDRERLEYLKVLGVPSFVKD